MLTQKSTAQGEVQRAFGLDSEEALALWRTPVGDWVVVTHGQRVAFVLNNLTEWKEVAAEDQAELTAGPEGRVYRDGQAVAPGDPAWVLPAEVQAHALA